MAAPNIEQRIMTVAALVAAGVGRMCMPFPVALAGITGTGNVMQMVPGFKGRIMSLDFTVQTVASTAAKLASLNPAVAGTNCTGGVVALTTANCTPAGNVVNGSAITALNGFTSTQTISIKSSSVTAFAEGSGAVIMCVMNDDTIDAVAKALGLFNQ